MSRFWGYSKRPKNWQKLLEENDESKSSKKTENPIKTENPLSPIKPIKPVTNSCISYT
jgi:hypothetical protein